MSPDASENRPISGLLQSLDDLCRVLGSEADESERIHRPTPAAQDALRSSGVLRLMLAEDIGGYAAGPSDVVKVVERIAHTDASTAWLVRSLISETAVAASRLTAGASADLFREQPGAIVAGMSRGETGDGIVLADGQVRINGRWRYVPGLSMATHVNLPVRIPGAPTIVCVVPRAAVRISDNWEMLGLKASGAFDVEAYDVVVPGHLTFPRDGSFVPRGGYVNRLSAASLSSINQSAWSQGVARRVLDELAVYAERRPRAPGSSLPPEFFAEYARYSYLLRSNSALLRDTLRSGEGALSRGEDLPDEVDTFLRLIGGLSTQTAVDVSHFAHRFAGVHVMRNGTLQRVFRDAHTGAQHRGSNAAVAAHAGMLLSGALAPGSGWNHFDAQHSSADGTEVGE